MKNEALLAELHRLLDAGEHLLTQFPKLDPDYWSLLLPHNISDEMRCYSADVSWRAEDRKWYQDYHQRATTVYLAERVQDLEVGLLGWRAIGVLQ